MQRKRRDPIAEELAKRPLPPDRDLGVTYRISLSGLDLRDITDLVFKQLQGARERYREAPTQRQRLAAEERARHWWQLYDKLLP